MYLSHIDRQIFYFPQYKKKLMHHCICDKTSSTYDGRYYVCPIACKLKQVPFINRYGNRFINRDIYNNNQHAMLRLVAHYKPAI